MHELVTAGHLYSPKVRGGLEHGAGVVKVIGADRAGLGPGRSVPGVRHTSESKTFGDLLLDEGIVMANSPVASEGVYKCRLSYATTEGLTPRVVVPKPTTTIE